MRVFLAGRSGVVGVKGDYDHLTVWYREAFTDIDTLVAALNEQGYDSTKTAAPADAKPGKPRGSY